MVKGGRNPGDDRRATAMYVCAQSGATSSAVMTIGEHKRKWRSISRDALHLSDEKVDLLGDGFDASLLYRFFSVLPPPAPNQPRTPRPPGRSSGRRFG